nr:uncharacterized protein LOC113706031 [Coffea arabica]
METRIKADGGNKVKLMCSYGGKILPRPRTCKLTYVGGDTKLLTVDRNAKFSDIVKKLNSLFNFKTDDILIKYQLPGEDLDVLISLTGHDDLENMMVEYDRFRFHRIPSPHNKPVRIRLFVFSSARNPANPTGSKSGSGAPLNPDYLFGFDKHCDFNSTTTDMQASNSATKSTHDLEPWKIPCTVHPRNIPSNSSLNPNCHNANEVQKVTARDGHVAVRVANQLQLSAYGFPVISVGLEQARQRSRILMPGMMKVGMMNGDRLQQPIYNFVPTMPSVPE